MEEIACYSTGHLVDTLWLMVGSEGSLASHLVDVESHTAYMEDDSMVVVNQTECLTDQ